MKNVDIVDRFKSLLLEMRNTIDTQLTVLDKIEIGKSQLSPTIISLTCLKHYFLCKELLTDIDEKAKDFYLDLEKDKSILLDETILALEEHKKEKDLIMELAPILLLYLINKKTTD